MRLAMLFDGKNAFVIHRNYLLPRSADTEDTRQIEKEKKDNNIILTRQFVSQHQ
jgi:hypothetical protein